MAFDLSCLIYAFLITIHSYLGCDAGSSSCVTVSGIGSGAKDFVTVDTLSSIPSDIFGYFEYVNTLEGYPIAEPNVEGSIAFRSFLYAAIFMYNTAVNYEETSIEVWGRTDVTEARRFCQPSKNDADETQIFDLHRRAALAHGIYYFMIRANLGSDAVSTWAALMAHWGLDATICDDNDDSGDCDDLSTPWGLAYAVANEIDTFAETDGWNQDGSYNREYNRIPFSDFRDDDTLYVPVNSPWEITNKRRWQPLLETNDVGYLWNQEFVTPHIGFTGKSFMYDEDDFCDFSSYDPDYDYDDEVEYSLDRMANLDEDDLTEIIQFDDKIILSSLYRQAFYASDIGDGTLTSFEYLQRQLAVAMTLYEACLVVWKEKINFDAIRPLSMVHYLLGDEDVTTYAGQDENGESLGTQTFPASNWEPVVRTMPHAEYPSASACVCEAFAQAVMKYEGKDDFSDVLPDGMILTVSGLFRDVYFGEVVADEDDLTYTSWSDISTACGESRISGGMHFRDAVPAGQSLCSEIGTDAAEFVQELVNGDTPKFVVDAYDTSYDERDCDSNKGKGH